MKLLKYVMTHDTGLAPNPYFGVCSLAVCTPNHMNANLQVGDWVLGHTTAATGRRLVYAMRLTRVLDMPTYFREFPKKRPKVNGGPDERCGDNIYDFREGHWIRTPSALHNDPMAFKQDQNRKVYLAEGDENFWYFGGLNPNSFVLEFADRFRNLVRDRQGFSYIDDETTIRDFTNWLAQVSTPGCRGTPRDSFLALDKRYLIQIEPSERWISHEELGPASQTDVKTKLMEMGAQHMQTSCRKSSSGCESPPSLVTKRRGCS